MWTSGLNLIIVCESTITNCRGQDGFGLDFDMYLALRSLIRLMSNRQS